MKYSVWWVSQWDISLKTRIFKFWYMTKFPSISRKFLAQPFFWDVRQHWIKWRLFQRLTDFENHFHLRTKSVTIDPTKSIIVWTKNYQLTKVKKKKRNKEKWMNSPIYQLTIFAITQTLNISQSKHIGLIKRCTHSPSLFCWWIIGHNCCIYCHNLQMTRPKKPETRYSSSLIYQQNVYRK